MATCAEMKDALFDFMDGMYSKIGTLCNSNGFRYRHVDGMTLYAYLSGRFPDESISKCFTVVQDVREFCVSSESAYPYPDGEYWTIEELERYTAWRKRT